MMNRPARRVPQKFRYLVFGSGAQVGDDGVAVARNNQASFGSEKLHAAARATPAAGLAVRPERREGRLPARAGVFEERILRVGGFTIVLKRQSAAA